jgi:hypothetical protein
MFYSNDVIKPAGYNSKSSFALFGIELTGPYDTHALTLHGEPFWSHKVVPHEDGSVSLILGNIDPVYRMKVNFAGRLYPGLGALQLRVSCYNSREGQQPYMFWISGSMRSTEKTRFVYPMTRTIGHTTSEVADWPFYGDVDYSWDRNNKHMLGVFGIDIYDDFQGANCHPLADATVVDGTCILDGETLEFAPEWSGSMSAAYRLPLQGDREFYSWLGYDFKSDYLADATRAPYAEDIDFGVWNGSLGWRSSHWDISLWGKNLTDETYVTTTVADLFGIAFANPILIGDVNSSLNHARWLNEPRMWGVTLRYTH